MCYNNNVEREVHKMKGVLTLKTPLDGVAFNIGQIVLTQGVHNMVQEDDKFADFVGDSFKRHCQCDWGDLCREDKEMNENALRNGERLFSKYNFNDKVSIYIITEWDGSATTILFPNEY